MHQGSQVNFREPSFRNGIFELRVSAVEIMWSDGENVRIGSKSGNTHNEPMFSALPPKPDIARRDWHVRFVPKADIAAYATSAKYVRAVDLSRADKAAK